MSSKRKSFVLHKDSLDILPDLTDDQAGKLFKAIHAYQIDDEISLDQITKMVFLPFKNQFIRDDEKYLETCERRAVAGSKGGKQKVANASNCKQKVANVADSDSKSKSDSKSDSKSNSLVEEKPQRSKHKYSDVDYQCAEWIYGLVVKVAPSSKTPNFESWANTIRLMRDSDKLDHDIISRVFTWANQDSFWSVNILSAAKLREKFPQLQAKMANEHTRPKSTGRTSGNLSACEDFING
tara:strand:+ start:4423 stop:5139 length:717 start_codon:yes stop_codon:yes gene_type:complete